MRRNRTLLLVLVFIAQAASSQTNRVGTFERPSIVLAYYRSPQWAATLKEKRAEMGEAKRAADQAKIQQLDAWGGQAQELAHE